MIKNPSKEKFDIIIIAGQSNAESSGVGPSYNEDWVEDDDILMLKGDFNAKVAKKAYGNEYLDIEVSNEYYIEKAKDIVNRILNNEVEVFMDAEDLQLVKSFATETPYIIDKLYSKVDTANPLLFFIFICGNSA